MSYVRKLSLLLNNLLEVIDFKSRGKLFRNLQLLYFTRLCPIDVWQPVRWCSCRYACL